MSEAANDRQDGQQQQNNSGQEQGNDGGQNGNGQQQQQNNGQQQQQQQGSDGKRTIAGSGDQGQQQQDDKGYWPADWRDKLAGTDKALRTRLDRFADPNGILKSFRSLEERLSSGELRAQLPKDAKPEDVARFRKDNGLPEKPEDYKAELPQGFVLGEADKPLVSDFSKMAHENLWTPQQFNQALGWYYGMQDSLAQQRQKDDDRFHDKSVSELKEHYGKDYNRSIAAIGNLLSAHLGKEEHAALLNARLPDGRLLGDSPAIIKSLAAIALEMNPAATLIPAGDGDPQKGIATRKAELEKMMGERQSAYWKGPEADKLQQEYRDLVDAENKFKQRAA